MIAETVTKKCQWCRAPMSLGVIRFDDKQSSFVRFALAFSISTLFFTNEKVWICPTCGRIDEVEL